MQNDITYTPMEKIDLRELVLILKRRQILVMLITLIVTILAIVYVLIAKPVYEIRSIVEVSLIDNKPVQSINDTKQKLDFTYEVDIKGKEVEMPLVSEISIPKKTTSLLVIKTQGYSNEDAAGLMTKIVDEITTQENEKITIYKDTVKEKLTQVEEDISRNEKTAVELKGKIADYESKFLNISKKDAALAGIYAIEIGKKQSELYSMNNRISALRSQKNDLALSISDLRIQPTRVIGNFEVLDKPIKPKKALIIVVAFVTGLMLAVFLAFFLEFVQTPKEEENE
ncbi:Wzz/FepE/Etk N-terminal domain-containing protein [Sulfurimonas sp. HSL3-7]|uniref:Wzz/FepE/Etk N-terminal domain-containing protein n=1 Tax=Sulfonitrofixus jiaomeiensis TaxID=3131938 RepID=UPI0031F90023